MPKVVRDLVHDEQGELEGKRVDRRVGAAYPEKPSHEQPVHPPARLVEIGDPHVDRHGVGGVVDLRCRAGDEAKTGVHGHAVPVQGLEMGVVGPASELHEVGGPT
jgi:hypothetical protein